MEFFYEGFTGEHMIITKVLPSHQAATLIALGVDFEKKDGNGRTANDLVELHGPGLLC